MKAGRKGIAAAVIAIAVGANALFGAGVMSASSATIQMKDSTGWDIYTGAGYRYGPSIIQNSDGSLDMWTCGPGGGSAWDYVYYKRSTDGGHTWGTEAPAIAPTPGSRDTFSTCDPGVIKLGSYYYLGYTSTEDSAGNVNQLYVARSLTPGSGYVKWNGTGWGGNPQPIVTYTGPSSGYGVGEPSLVEKDGTLFVYYTYLDGTGLSQTRLATASATNANWPGALTQRGVAIQREQGGNAGFDLVEDSSDVKYVDSLGKFVAVAESNRLRNDSYTVAYESTDGLTFVPSVFTNIDKQNYSHNVGISGTPNGHLDTTKPNFVAFAYGPNWAAWHLHLSPISFAAQQVGVTYRSHVQSIGWQGWVADDRFTGTQGQALRLEAFQLSLTNPTAGAGVSYQSYVQGSGWQASVSNGATSGTSGQSLYIEAIRLVMSNVPAGYHLKYRVHQQDIGWSDWKVDGQQAGTTGQGKRIEAFQAFVYKD